MGTQQFCLRWNHHQNNMLTVFEQLLSNEALVDVTLACEGLSLKAHKTILSACSPFFQSLFLENPCKHPIVILKDIKYSDLKAVVEFMYRGEVNVTQDQLSALLKIAETLQVKGLAEIADPFGQKCDEVVMDTTHPLQNLMSGSEIQVRTSLPLLNNKKRLRNRKRSNSGSIQNDSIDCLPAGIKEHPSSSEEMDSTAAKILNISDDSSQETISPHIQQQPTSHCSNLEYANENQSVVTENSHLKSIPTDYCRNAKPPQDIVYDMEPYNLLEQSMTTDNLSISAQESLSSQLNVPNSRHKSNVNSSQINLESPKCLSSLSQQSSFSKEIDQSSPVNIKKQIMTPNEITCQSNIKTVVSNDMLQQNNMSLSTSSRTASYYSTTWTDRSPYAENTRQAVQAVLTGNWTLRKASEYYQIPLTTLWKRVQCAKSKTVTSPTSPPCS